MRRRNRNSPSSPDPVTAYAQAVLAGTVVAGPFVRLACQRHLADLKTAKRRGLVWNPPLETPEGPVPAVQLTLEFFSTMLLLGVGQPFVLRDWQAFVVGSLFGWYQKDGTRRFRTAYVETGKGSGKTPLAAGIGLKGLIADQTDAAEIYSAATDREQARICFLDAKRMVERSPELLQAVDPNVASLVYGKRGATFRPVSSEHRGLDGKRVHIAILDELHEHLDAIVADKMRAGTKKDPNAIIFEITNSGYNRESVCWKHREYSRQVLEGTIENDSWFAYVCALDPEDDWQDEKVWPKVNPSLPDLPGLPYLRGQVQEALGMPSRENIVKRLNFCIWTEQADRWLSMELWDRGAMSYPDPELLGRPVFLGLDLASTTDLNALALFFPLDDGRYVLRCRFWMPADNVAKRVQQDHVPYDVWIREGFIEATAGNTTDYDVIRTRILEESARYNVRDLAFDRWNANQLTTQLQDAWPERKEPNAGRQIVGFGQGFASMSAPTKEFEKLLLSDRLLHGGNPVLRWMASNVSVRQDPAGNLKPDKSTSSERIDGIVASIMALGRAMLQPKHISVYESRGLLEVEL